MPGARCPSPAVGTGARRLPACSLCPHQPRPTFGRSGRETGLLSFDSGRPAISADILVVTQLRVVVQFVTFEDPSMSVTADVTIFWD